MKRFPESENSLVASSMKNLYLPKQGAIFPLRRVDYTRISQRFPGVSSKTKNNSFCFSKLARFAVRGKVVVTMLIRHCVASVLRLKLVLGTSILKTSSVCYNIIK